MQQPVSSGVHSLLVLQAASSEHHSCHHTPRPTTGTGRKVSRRGRGVNREQAQLLMAAIIPQHTFQFRMNESCAFLCVSKVWPGWLLHFPVTENRRVNPNFHTQFPAPHLQVVETYARIAICKEYYTAGCHLLFALSGSLPRSTPATEREYF